MSRGSSKYLDQLIAALPRVLSALNRTEGMASFGCFDRNWWHYKITDFPSARMQEAVLTLALLFREPWSPYRNNPQFFRWVEAALNFWVMRQHRDGSVEEWYPGERSFVATAFSVYAASETLLLVPELKNKERVLASLRRSADWLLSERETTVFNQNSGAILALYNVYLITKDERYKKGAEALVRHMAAHQSAEGWFLEYGGPDIGYLSLTIDYLSKYWLKSQDPEAKPILEKALRFISHFIHPDGSAGGIYGSRNTAYLIPSGFEALASAIPTAAAIAEKAREGYASGVLPVPGTIDDRYLLQNGYTFLQAHGTSLERKEIEKEPLPCDSDGVFEFPEAGLIVRSDPKSYLVVNGKKGGVAYQYDKARKAARWCGGLVLRKGGATYISGSLETGSQFVGDAKSSAFLVEGRLVREGERVLDSVSFTGLRFVHFLFSLLPNGEKMLKNLLRKILISKRVRTTWKFTRKFEMENGTPKIQDTFPSEAFDENLSGSYEEFIYIPSSRLFLESQLNSRNYENRF